MYDLSLSDDVENSFFSIPIRLTNGYRIKIIEIGSAPKIRNVWLQAPRFRCGNHLKSIDFWSLSFDHCIIFETEMWWSCFHARLLDLNHKLLFLVFELLFAYPIPKIGFRNRNDTLHKYRARLSALRHKLLLLVFKFLFSYLIHKIGLSNRNDTLHNDRVPNMLVLFSCKIISFNAQAFDLSVRTFDCRAHCKNWSFEPEWYTAWLSSPKRDGLIFMHDYQL